MTHKKLSRFTHHIMNIIPAKQKQNPQTQCQNAPGGKFGVEVRKSSFFAIVTRAIPCMKLCSVSTTKTMPARGTDYHKFAGMGVCAA